MHRHALGSIEKTDIDKFNALECRQLEMIVGIKMAFLEARK
jgi:hypothetical protein